MVGFPEVRQQRGALLQQEEKENRTEAPTSKLLLPKLFEWQPTLFIIGRGRYLSGKEGMNWIEFCRTPKYGIRAKLHYVSAKAHMHLYVHEQNKRGQHLLSRLVPAHDIQDDPAPNLIAAPSCLSLYPSTHYVVWSTIHFRPEGNSRGSWLCDFFTLFPAPIRMPFFFLLIIHF